MTSRSESTDPPGAVSSQNQEQAEGGHADTGTDARPDQDAKGGAEGAPGEREQPDSGDSAPGSASEGSQATGHPGNAG